jgi:2-amino-4-hydroxy-6-hydroxymethyldihydropteridine diphosphokinase
MREVAFIALGSNLGDREAHLSFARAEIAALTETRILDATAPEETPPFGPAGQPAYLNQMLAIETAMNPHALLAALQDIERRAGRTRTVRWGARTLDLDIVQFGERMIADDRLVVPHPGLKDRDFWQRELAELRTSR